MFFFSPVMSMAFINIAAAVLPAIFLLRYIYRKDKIEKEPGSLLRGCVISGLFAVAASIVLEMAGGYLLGLAVEADDPLYLILFAFLIGGAVCTAYAVHAVPVVEEAERVAAAALRGTKELFVILLCDADEIHAFLDFDVESGLV